MRGRGRAIRCKGSPSFCVSLPLSQEKKKVCTYIYIPLCYFQGRRMLWGDCVTLHVK